MYIYKYIYMIYISQYITYSCIYVYHIYKDLPNIPYRTYNIYIYMSNMYKRFIHMTSIYHNMLHIYHISHVCHRCQNYSIATLSQSKWQCPSTLNQLSPDGKGCAENDQEEQQ